MPGGRERSFGQPRQGPPRGLKARDPGSRPSAYVEAAEAFWLLDLDLHCGHACSLRAVTAPLDELVHRFRVAFNDYFHPAVRAVARPAGDAERERLLCAATAVPNPLDSAPDPEVPAGHLQKLAAVPCEGSSCPLVKPYFETQRHRSIRILIARPEWHLVAAAPFRAAGHRPGEPACRR